MTNQELKQSDTSRFQDSAPIASNDNMPLLRLHEVLRLVPVSRACWYAGMKSGVYPLPVKLGARIVAWRWADIAPLLQRGL
ncbi:helix-turn-helix transcriptional regulator [Xanthobacter pseudotagetidis]|uniref:helix-turn-helix transcriptional regulator n=1 Tax=Xanthobacter pseudotagetidis TaxID=3119911 RepID=UPI0037296892